jgi:DNA mismatch repair protein MSH4
LTRALPLRPHDRLKSLDLDKVVSRLLAPRRPATTANSAPPARRPTATGADASIKGLALFSQLAASASADPSLRIAHHLAHLISLRTFLNAVPSLRASVENASSPLLLQIERALSDDRIDEIREVLKEGMNDDVWNAAAGNRGGGHKGKGGAESAMIGKHQRLFAIKAERKRLYAPVLFSL